MWFIYSWSAFGRVFFVPISYKWQLFIRFLFKLKIFSQKLLAIYSVMYAHSKWRAYFKHSPFYSNVYSQWTHTFNIQTLPYLYLFKWYIATYLFMFAQFMWIPIAIRLISWLGHVVIHEANVHKLRSFFVNECFAFIFVVVGVFFFGVFVIVVILSVLRSVGLPDLNSTEFIGNYQVKLVKLHKCQ